MRCAASSEQVIFAFQQYDLKQKLLDQVGGWLEVGWLADRWTGSADSQDCIELLWSCRVNVAGCIVADGHDA